MEIIIQDTAEDCAKLGAAIIRQTMERKANTVLGLATGSTPLKLYEELVRDEDTIAAVRVLKSSVSVAPEPADWARLTSETTLAIAGFGG